MAKKMLCSAALLGALLLFAGLALAQDRGSIQPTPTIGEQVLVRPSPGVLKEPFSLMPKNSPLQPSYCSPCLFYGGDGDPTNPNADGLWDNNSADFGIDAQVYSPFTPVKVKKQHGKAWVVSGLFANIEYNPYPPAQPMDAVWAVYSGVVAGGTPATAKTVCSGTDSAPVLTDTGRLYFGLYEEYTTAVAVSGCSVPFPKKKGGGAYWEQVTPEYGATGTFQLAYESNAPDTPPNEAFGPPEPVDMSYFYGPAFGFTSFTNTTQLGPFDIFSAGVEGNVGK
jgi:hypothetical protein